MTPSRRMTWAVSALLVACMISSAVVLRHIDQMRPAAPIEEVLYISSPKVLKRLTLGYDGLLADIYWTRVVQYFGSKHFAGAQRYDLLAPLLEITPLWPPMMSTADPSPGHQATRPAGGGSQDGGGLTVRTAVALLVTP